MEFKLGDRVWWRFGNRDRDVRTGEVVMVVPAGERVRREGIRNPHTNKLIGLGWRDNLGVLRKHTSYVVLARDYRGRWKLYYPVVSQLRPY